MCFQFDDASIVSTDQMALHVYGATIGRKPDAVYPILSKIRFGLPQNVMVVSGDADHHFVSIMIATKDIAAGEEIVMDYLFDWNSESPLSFKLMVKQGFSIKLSKHRSWPQTGKEILPQREQERVFMGLYSNGLVGRESGNERITSHPGCRGIKAANCKRKQQIEAFVNSGDIWKMVRGDIEPPSWAGETGDPQKSRLNASEIPSEFRVPRYSVNTTKWWPATMLSIFAAILMDNLLPAAFLIIILF